MTSKCSNCGAKLNENSKFCPICGTPVLEVSVHTQDNLSAVYTENSQKASTEKSSFSSIDPTTVSIEETAGILENAAHNAMKDIPEIVKISEANDTVLNNTAKKSEDKSAAIKEVAAKTEEKIESKKQQESRANNNISTTVPSKKSKTGLIIVLIVIIAALGVGAYFYMSGGFNPSNFNTTAVVVTTADIPEETEEVTDADVSAAEATVTAAAEQTTTITAAQTTITEETTTASQSVTTSETTVSETTASETVTELVSMKTAEELAAGISVELNHQVASGNDVTAEFSMSAAGISPEILSDNVLLLAEFTADDLLLTNIPSVVMMSINVDGSAIEVTPSSTSDGMVVFEYANMVSAVTAAGFTAADIDTIEFRCNSVELDVFALTIMQG